MRIATAAFQEIEERHYRGDEFIRKNVIAVYRFNDRNRIVHLDIYEQAKDSGRCIIEAARTAASWAGRLSIRAVPRFWRCRRRAGCHPGWRA